MGGANKLTVQDDGNLVVYNNSSPLWASNGRINNTTDNGRDMDVDVNKGYRFRTEINFIPDGKLLFVFPG
jgi:hypothetical protein